MRFLGGKGGYFEKSYGSKTSDMTLERLGEVFKGDSADTCGGKFPLVSMGGRAPSYYFNCFIFQVPVLIKTLDLVGFTLRSSRDTSADHRPGNRNFQDGQQIPPSCQDGHILEWEPKPVSEDDLEIPVIMRKPGRRRNIKKYSTETEPTIKLTGKEAGFFQSQAPIGWPQGLLDKSSSA
jgi:hypothetical protein